MSSLTTALVDAVLADEQALDALAHAIAPRLAPRPITSSSTLTTSEAAQRAGVHPRTITRAVAAGTLAARRVTNRWRIDPDDLTTWLDAGAPTSTTATHSNGRRACTMATAGADAISGRKAA